MANANPTGRYTLVKAPAILIYNKGLFEATAYQGKGTPKFSSGFVFAGDHPDLSGIKEAIAGVARAASPGIDLATIGKPLHKGDKLADKRKAKKGDKYTGDADWMRGKVVIIGRSQFPPSLSVFEPGRAPIDLSDDALKAKYRDKFFFGAEVYAEFAFVWYNAVKEGDKPGVTCYIQSVLATGKGTRMSGARPASDTFAGAIGHLSSESPLGGSSADLDDEIPF